MRGWPKGSNPFVGFPVVSSPFVPDGQWLLDADNRLWVGEYLGEAHDAIAAELVACTLGARSRPELVEWIL